MDVTLELAHIEIVIVPKCCFLIDFECIPLMYERWMRALTKRRKQEQKTTRKNVRAKICRIKKKGLKKKRPEKKKRKKKGWPSRQFANVHHQ